MRFQCTNCLSIVGIDDSEAGQAVACGHCETIIAVPTSRTASGSVIDDFVIEKEVGRGGLATVYLAHQISLDRSVALKILHAQYAEDAEFTSSFLREARAAAQLNHPNIVQAHAVGEEDGIHFFAMEYVQGTTLKNVLAHSGRLVIDRALMITQEIAKALDFAWTSKKLVHRDIKPDNIILTEEGQVKLADLGLARVGTDLLQEGSSEILGTPQYIAPELLLGKPADNRTDIYSLGATLFHAVTGQYPYQGSTAADIARKHISDSMPDPRSFVKDLPDAVAKLIGIMMAKRPGHRFSSARELLEELGRVQNGQAPVHTLTKSFQVPIDLSNVDHELEVTPEDLDAEADDSVPGDSGKARKRIASASATGKGGKVKISLKKGKPGRTSAKSTGASKQTGPAATAQEPVPEGQMQPGESNLGGDAAEAALIPEDTAAGAAATGRGGRRTKERQSSSKLLLKVMIFLVLLTVGALIAVVFLKQWQDQKRAEERLAQRGLTTEQAAAIEQYQRFVVRNPTYQQSLERAADLLDLHADSAGFRTEIMEIAAPFLEQEIRRLREQRHHQELADWRRTSRELRETMRQQEAEARQRELAEQRAEQARRDAELREEARQERIADLRRDKSRLRRQSVSLVRQHNFDAAKALFTGMRLSNIPEFTQWAETKQETIDMARRAYDSVRNSQDLLKGVRFSPPGRPERAEILSIGSQLISAEIRGYVRDEVEPVTVPLSRLTTQQIVTLMEEAWKLQDGDPAELDLYVGAYLLARGEYLNVSFQRLNRTSLTERAEPLLEELNALREEARAEI